MNYYIDLFSPETAQAFENSMRDVSGFRISRRAYVQNQKIGPGDKFICYVTRIQRFVGVLEVQSEPYQEDKPIFTKEKDPFVLRFKVKPVVWLPLEKAIPIHNDRLWKNLSFTKDLSNDSNKWTYMVFSSPRAWPKKDCEFLEKELLAQSKNLENFAFSEDEQKKLKTHKIRISDEKEVSVSVPDDEGMEETEREVAEKEKRTSIVVQAKLAEIGEKLGLKLWLPNGDRARVLGIWKPKDEDTLLQDLPLVFDETTLKTIRNIDVLWIKRRSIVRAFEVEDTTSIYSGILRMADLLALQPMLNIRIHIVAPVERREAVFKQITRPVFVLMGENPLSEVCSFISYDSVIELSKEKKLEHMNDSIIDEYSEYSED
ncbi:MAG: EVE domain-containing protein [Candidatus Aenigmarchaeota archaeon]|nr:EVE domain-containing protein [Candidatus Aenigmarchaeota archaeon]